MAYSPEAYPLSVNTPIDEYTHRPSGSVVDLVSTLHVGSPSYFGMIADHLATRVSEGFIVYKEGIREPLPDELDQANTSTKLRHRLVLACSEYAGRAIVGVEDSLSFTNQLVLEEELRSEPECTKIVNVDVSELDIARASSIYGLAQRVRSSRAFFRRLEIARQGGPLAYDEAIYKEIVDQFRESEASQRANPKKVNQAVVDERNEVVLEHLDELCKQNESAKAAVVWGYGHRKGLAVGLEARGFRHTKTKSLMVGFNPSPHHC